MIDTKKFYDFLISKGLDFFAGVPDSLLGNLCACIKENSSKEKNIITANEGNAIAMAAGYHLSTSKFGIVYMQNSGLGNAVNPLLSLVDEEVYNIPMLLIVGWRGEPGVHDEPQHIKQGKLTIELLDALGIKNQVLTENYEEQINECYEYMRLTSKPVALVIKKNTFSSYKSKKEESKYCLTREESLNNIINNLTSEDFIVSTTGKTSREIFEIREKNNQSHSNDFLTVGSMGHASSIALGMSLGTNKNVYCIDGDGAFIMHMGANAVNTSIARDNFKYIVINNGAHESVGGQPTVGFSIEIDKILEACGFKNAYKASTIEEINEYMKRLRKELLSALIIYTKQGSREDLGRPTITPVENKGNLMRKLELR